ncbi:hypothetical protein ALC57_15011, partial [Trachymyrmex cornetzi]
IQGDKENQLSYNGSELIGEFSESGPRQDHRWTIVRAAEQEVYNDARALSRDTRGMASANARSRAHALDREISCTASKVDSIRLASATVQTVQTAAQRWMERRPAESCEPISAVVLRRGDFNNAPVRVNVPPCTGISRGLKTHVQELFRRRAEKRHGTTYFSSPRTLIGRFTNYKAQGGQRTLAGILVVVKLHLACERRVFVVYSRHPISELFVRVRPDPCAYGGNDSHYNVRADARNVRKHERALAFFHFLLRSTGAFGNNHHCSSASI